MAGLKLFRGTTLCAEELVSGSMLLMPLAALLVHAVSTLVHAISGWCRGGWISDATSFKALVPGPRS